MNVARRAAQIALVVAVVMCFAGIFQHELWTPDEPREAEVGREMLASHFSALPTLGGEPFLEKPPLGAWTTAASYEVFGVSAGAARIPAALFAVGAAWIAYLLGKRAAGRLAGLCSAVALLTMVQFAETSHKAVLDVALTFFVAAGHLAFLRLRDRDSIGGYAAVAVLSGVAFLTKSWMGPALLCAPPILAVAALREWAVLKRVLPRAFLASVLGVAAIGGPWVLALAHTDGAGWPAVKTCLVTEYVGRAVGGADFAKSGHQNPPWYYVWAFPLVLLPWVFAAPALLKSEILRRDRRGGRTLFLGVLVLAGVLLLSLPTGKRDLYLVPLLPAAAAVIGTWLSRVGSRSGGPWDLKTSSILKWLAISLLIAVLVACQYLALRLPLPHSVPDSVRTALGAERIPFAAVVVAGGLLLVLSGVLVKRTASTPVGRQAAWPATVLVVLLVVLQAGVLPRIDGFKSMASGAREIAALVPDGEPLLALSADETTLAVVPFYSGRLLANVEDPAEALRRLESGPTRHLIVMDKDARKLSPALKARLDLVKSVTFAATREVNVYAVKP